MMTNDEAMTKTERFLKLVRENPDLPIVPMVSEEVVGEGSAWWEGEWSHSKVTEYYNGRNHIHFRDDDEEDILSDMAGCAYDKTKDGREIYDLSDEEWDECLDSLEWKKAIVVYIDI